MTELEGVSGVGPAAAKKLREVFVTTAELLAVQNPVELQRKTKLGEGTVEKIVRNARILLGMHGFKSGLEVEKEMESKSRLKTGIEKMDEALFGGIEVGSLVEIYGPARGGKTQVSAHLAVRAQLPRDQGGLEGRILWLDTESSFKPMTIRANALRWGLDPDIALGNVGRAEIFESIPQLCSEQDYVLVVVDSFTGLFRAEYTGLESLRIRQQEMNALLNQMRRTAKATDAVFVYTNQVMSKISTYGGYDNAPIGGHILSHASDYRFYTRRTKEDKRKLQLIDNAGLPEFDVEMVVGWGGMYADSKSKKEKEPEILDYFEKQGVAEEDTEIELEEAEVPQAEAGEAG
jgi:DNA repair protein RadA